MKRLIDLHVHSNVSDGVLAPEEIIKKAKEQHIVSIGLCDHDTVDGIERAVVAGSRENVDVVPGIELSTVYGSLDLHVLGYFIDYKNQKFIRRLRYLAEKRTERALKIATKLKELGFFLDEKTLIEESKRTAIGKPHIVLALFNEEKNATKLKEEFGNCPTVGKFIQHYLNYGQAAYVPKVKLSTLEAISLIHGVDGVAVLAHPGFDIELNDEGKKTIASFADQGLDGLEIISLIESEARTRECMRFFSRLADSLHLIKTGGSDYHGYENCEAAEIGSTLGFIGTPFSVPEEYLVELKKRHKQIEKNN